MGDEDKQKIIELHERLEKLDKERDELKSKVEKQLTWWKNPAMLTALMGVLAGIGTTAENYWSRSQKDTENQEEDQVDQGTHRAAYKFLMKRQGEIEEVCSSYTSVIVNVLTPAQRRLVKAQAETLGLPELELASALVSHPPVAPVTAHIGAGHTEVEVSTDAAADELPSEPTDIFDAIRQRVKAKKEVDLDELGEQFHQRKR